MLSPLFMNAVDKEIEQLISALRSADCFRSEIDFSVTMPQLTDDVIYKIMVESQATEGNDPLLPCDYIIDWKLEGRGEPLTGFSAYFQGHHYRFRGEKLQEYHMEWDSVPFMPAKFGLTRGVSVQKAAQFVDLLPQVMADDLSHLLADSLYRVVYHSDTIVGGQHRKVLDIDVIVNGTVGRELEYVFDQVTLMPVRTIFENSPGSVAEQTVEVKYLPVSDVDPCNPINENRLIEKYPLIFEQYRQSNFSIENMRGKRLPGFSVPTTTGERYTRRISDPMRAPTILVMMDQEGGFNKQLVKAVRDAADGLPFESDIIWAFTGNNIDMIEESVPSIRPGESLLKSARSLARDCGVADLPVILLINSGGIVENVILGFNNTLSTDVLQKMSIIK